MKTTLSLILLSACGLGISLADQTTGSPLPAPTAYRIVEQGGNHNLWQRETYEKLPDGQVVTHVHKFYELATGLNFQAANGSWQPSQATIQSTPSGAVMSQAEYQVIFANNLNSSGSIDLQTPDQKNLQSSILGLAFYDPSTGQSALFAQIQESQGELISTNQILYPNAFQGLNASVRYTTKNASMEQDVILNEQLPDCTAYGMNPATTEIEVITEFINPPQETITPGTTQPNGETDENIAWGVTGLGHGKAFDLGAPNNLHSRVNVIRQYVTQQGRKILLEKVPLNLIQPSLQNLPPHAAIKTHSKLPKTASKTLILPKARLAQTEPKPVKLASAPPSNRGYVLDFVEVNTDQTDFTFQGDTTYLVDGGFNITGTVTCEGGAVIKEDLDGEIDIDSGGSITCHTAPYSPAIFTSINDDSVGESVSEDPYYTGTPGLGDVDRFLSFFCASPVLSNMRFSYASTAVSANSTGSINFWDCQFINVDIAVSAGWTDAGLYNVLIVECFDDTPVEADGNVIAENVTCDGSDYFTGPGNALAYAGGELCFTNCLITLPGSGSSYAVSFDGTNFTEVAYPIYQTVGAASYYLATNSPYRNAGTTNISPALLADLATKTTYPPIVYDGVSLTNTVYSPQAQRDNSGNPSLGYHYDPLDYCFSSCSAPTNLTFTAGTAIGWFEDSQMYGIGLGYGVTATFTGTATAPCVLARYSTVQDQYNGNWGSKGYLGAFTGEGGTGDDLIGAGLASLWFTKLYGLANDPNYFRDDSSWVILNATHSEFHSGQTGGYAVQFWLTNCLLECSPVILQSGVSANGAIVLQNCTEHRGYLGAQHYSGATWPVIVNNSSFDSADFSQLDSACADTSFCTYSNNAYITGQGTLPVTSSADQTVSSFNWQTSWFGNYYLPPGSPLIDAGSCTAPVLGLYHFTTQTNETVEGDSIVDIGYHYVATDTCGNPLDSNGNGIPDYIEDSTGAGQPLTVTLIAPTNSAWFSEPANINLQATVFDWSSTVTNVSFYQGSTQITGVTSAPYQYIWPVVAAGAYTVFATAQDQAGSSTNSATNSITITNLCGSY